MWFKLYFKVLIALLLTGAMYGVLLPNAVSAQDSILVVIGIFGALAWPAFVVLYFRKELRKFKKCVKS